MHISTCPSFPDSRSFNLGKIPMGFFDRRMSVCLRANHDRQVSVVKPQVFDVKILMTYHHIPHVLNTLKKTSLRCHNRNSSVSLFSPREAGTMISNGIDSDRSHRTTAEIIDIVLSKNQLRIRVSGCLGHRKTPTFGETPP